MLPKSSRIKGGEGLLHACISSLINANFKNPR